MGLFVDTILVIITALGTIAGIIATVSALATVLAGTFATIVSVGGTIITILGSVGAAILSLPVVLAAAIAALAGFAIAYITNWRGTRDKTNAIINQIKRIVKRGFINFINAATKFLEGFVSNVVSLFGEIRNEVKTKFNNLIENATQFGKDFVSNFAEGIRDQIGEAIAAASDLANAVGSRISLPSVGGISTGGGLNSGGGTTTSSAGAALARQEGRTVIEIEGRQVERATRDFRSDGTDLRGRYG
jgi:phage-related protein